MSPSKKLSLPAAILININVMAGTGLFINTVILAQTAGILGAATYLLMGILLLPLIITFAQLLKCHPGGSFYEFGTVHSPLLGFLVSWAYFVAKLASATLGIHVFSVFAQQCIPVFSNISALLLDSIIVIIFSCANMLNVRVGQKIQYGFLIFKAIPILFVIGTGAWFYLSGTTLLGTEPLNITGITTSLPFVLYAFSGFEVCCSLSRAIQNPGYNGPRALIISYSIGVCAAVLYQFMFYTSLGTFLSSLSGYSAAFPALVATILSPTSKLYTIVLSILLLGIGSSSLGSAYGIMYSNSWNLYALADNKHLIFSTLIKKLNTFGIPGICVLFEGVLILMYTYLFEGNQIPLQQMLSLGMIITYGISTFSLFVTTREKKIMRGVALLAFGSCFILAMGYVKNIFAYGALPTLFYGMLLMVGVIMFFIKNLTKL